MFTRVIKSIFFITVFCSFINSYVVADENETPIIVVSPTKFETSLNQIGSSVAIVSGESLEATKEVFLQDALSKVSGVSFFQNGGSGSTSGIMIRGFPKRYSAVYIDGVKITDPSTPTGTFNPTNLLVGDISRVEILKGSQSSIYGSHAIGGVINIFTKKGEEGLNYNYKLESGSKRTFVESFNINGGHEEGSFSVNLQRFDTGGISSMTHHVEEDDDYRNNSLNGTLQYNLADNLFLDGAFRYADIYLQYDQASIADDQYPESQDEEASGRISLNHDYLNGQLINDIGISYTYYKRRSFEPGTSSESDRFDGLRYSLDYKGRYSFGNEHNLVFGISTETEDTTQESSWSGKPSNYFSANEQMNSFYTDYQFSPYKNLYLSLGGRLDSSSILDNTQIIDAPSGRMISKRASLAYFLERTGTKIRGTFGTGFRVPSLYEVYYGYSTGTRANFLKPEESKSFDVGLVHSFPQYGLDLDLSIFNLTYTNSIDATNANGSIAKNLPGTNKSRGVEIEALWYPKKYLDFGLSYTFNQTFDYVDAGDSSYDDYGTDLKNTWMVRVPKHYLNLNTNYRFMDDMANANLNLKFASKRRDYGNANNDWDDVTLNSYMVFDANINYAFNNESKIFVRCENIFDEKYEQAFQYNTPGRGLFVGYTSSF